MFLISVSEGLKKVASKIDKDAMNFMKKHPNPKDSAVEGYAKKQGYAPDKFEEAIYRITTKLMKK